MSCRRILVVEDDPAIRETIQAVLELEGYRVTSAENGQAALQLLEEQDQPCLILLDLMMPVMNGWEFLEAIRKKDAVISTVPIAVVSAAADLASVECYGCKVLQKPTDIDHLLAVAQEHCGERR